MKNPTVTLHDIAATLPGVLVIPLDSGARATAAAIDVEAVADALRTGQTTSGTNRRNAAIITRRDADDRALHHLLVTAQGPGGRVDVDFQIRGAGPVARPKPDDAETALRTVAALCRDHAARLDRNKPPNLAEHLARANSILDDLARIIAASDDFGDMTRSTRYVLVATLPTPFSPFRATLTTAP